MIFHFVVTVVLIVIVIIRQSSPIKSEKIINLFVLIIMFSIIKLPIGIGGRKVHCWNITKLKSWLKSPAHRHRGLWHALFVQDTLQFATSSP